jgi:hypothetical protein
MTRKNEKLGEKFGKTLRKKRKMARGRGNWRGE